MWISFLVVQLGTSPLHLAAQYGHYSTTEVLLRAGVSRDARTKVDRTPLHMAASEGHASIVEVLLKVCVLQFCTLLLKVSLQRLNVFIRGQRKLVLLNFYFYYLMLSHFLCVSILNGNYLKVFLCWDKNTSWYVLT